MTQNGSSPLEASVILSTYNQPRSLELVLWGLAGQSRGEFEVIVADDGSGPETRETVDRMRAATGLPIGHVWHEDRGFRKTEILNRALLRASSDYIIVTDGDCIPRDDFVQAHLELARPGRYLSGGYLKLPPELSARITAADVKSGRVFEGRWLRAGGWRRGHRLLRLTRTLWLSRLMDHLTPTGASWNGHNSSTWKQTILDANGFDLDMGYKGEDRALGERLDNRGLRGLLVRFRAPVVHLHHDRPYADPEVILANQEIRRRIRRNGECRARRGIEEMLADDETGASAGQV